MDKLYQTIRAFNRFNPDYFSITWGAGGSTVRKSLDVASTIENEIGRTCVVHFTGLGMTQQTVDELPAGVDQSVDRGEAAQLLVGPAELQLERLEARRQVDAAEVQRCVCHPRRDENSLAPAAIFQADAFAEMRYVRSRHLGGRE